MSRDDRGDRVVVEAQRAQPLARELGADDVVVVEAHRAARLEPAGGGLADVVQQRGEAHDEVGGVEHAARLLVVDRLLEHREAVLVDVLVAVVLVDARGAARAARAAPVRRARIRRAVGCRRRGASVSSSFDSSSRTRSAEMRSISAARSSIAMRVESSTSKPSCDAKRAARSMRSGSSPNDCSGGGGGAQHAGHEVFDAARRVDELELRQPQRERVHGEVAAREVVFEDDAEHDLGLARVAVVGVGAVGGDLDGLAGDLRADGAERTADVPVGLGDGLHDREDLVGRGIRREIEVVLTGRPRNASRTGPPTRAISWPACLERRGEPRNGRRSRQLAQPVEGRRDTLHAPMLSGVVRRRPARPPPTARTSSGCTGPNP